MPLPVPAIQRQLATEMLTHGASLALAAALRRLTRAARRAVHSLR